MPFQPPTAPDFASTHETLAQWVTANADAQGRNGMRVYRFDGTVVTAEILSIAPADLEATEQAAGRTLRRIGPTEYASSPSVGICPCCGGTC